MAMRMLGRILVAMAVMSALAYVHSAPASADHDDPAGTNWPCTSWDGLPPPLPRGCNGDAYHEEMPDLARAIQADICLVTGQLSGAVTFGGPQHYPGFGVPLVNEDPAHSHFQFVESIVSCLGTGDLQMDVDGGHDGHMIDVLDWPHQVPDLTPLEVDPITSGAPQHEFDDHHGWTDESSWSNSSLYSGGQGGGRSNACVSNRNDNKADISVGSFSGAESGWVKYVRLGPVLFFWGCLEPGGPISGANPFFSGVLTIVTDLVPIALPPFVPGWGDPTCLVPASFVPCGYLVAGVALRGPGWLVDGETLPSPLP